ncbi:WD40-repeat-containing domain protein [Zopfochytrium polystomum]|nr:WD40-repeat-containing domain protein [Zopfochytrium polystomum]
MRANSSSDTGINSSSSASDGTSRSAKSNLVHANGNEEGTAQRTRRRQEVKTEIFRSKRRGQASSSQSVSTSLHRCRFVQHVPSAINALAFTPSASIPGQAKPLMACARANGDIEIWNPVRWHHERTIPGIPGSTIECILWLSSVRKDELQFDSEPESDEESRQSQTGGGAIWCMALSPGHDQVAIGCEDGSVRLFSVGKAQGDTIEYRTILDRQEGRVLSVAFHPTLPILAAGSTDSCIRFYDTKTHRAITRVTLDTVAHEGDTLVWALSYLPDGTLVAGDSLGAVSFWHTIASDSTKKSKSSSNYAVTLNSRVKSHLADVLCMAVSVDASEYVVFSSGVDRKVVQYRRNAFPESRASASRGNSRKDSKVEGSVWVACGERRYHSHDVRSLACYRSPSTSQLGAPLLHIDVLVSGGIDTTLTVASPATNFPSPCKLNRMAPFPQRTPISVAYDARLMLAREADRVKVWSLGAVHPADSAAIVESRHKLVHGVKNGQRLGLKDTEHLVADIKLKRSPSGTIVQSPTRLTRIHAFPSPHEIPGSSAMCFTPDCRRLILAGAADSVIRVVDVSTVLQTVQRGRRSKSLEFRILASFDTHCEDASAHVLPDTPNDVAMDSESGSPEAPEASTDEGRLRAPPASTKPASRQRPETRDIVDALVVSSDGQWLASGDLRNNIHLHSLDAYRFHATLPRLSALHTTVTFHPSSPATLVVTTARNEVFVFDAEEKGRMTDWSREYSGRLPTHFTQRNEIIMGCAISKHAPEKLIAWGATYICTIDLSKPLGPQDAPLTSKRKRAPSQPPRGSQQQQQRQRHPSPSRAAAARQSGPIIDTPVSARIDAAAPPAATPSGPVLVDGDKDDEDKVFVDDDGVVVIDSSSSSSEDDDYPAPNRRAATAAAASATSVRRTGATHKTGGGGDALTSSFCMHHQYGPIMAFGFVAAPSRDGVLVEEAFVVERPLLKVLEALPDGFWRKRYAS